MYFNGEGHTCGAFLLVFWGSEAGHRYGCIGSYGMKDGDEREVGPKDEDEEANRIEEIDQGSWDDLEKGSLVRYKDDGLETSPREHRTCMNTLRGCCFAFGLKELFRFGNDRSYYSLRDTWRDD
ncbi:hypothetical protein Bca52824_092023 [Brassica carinata]|uniref:Uncharacterized protein n=1 Tax=Brassica carinata TaxID=52824 RepID=A0A8X7NT25_BRACI|nr:hypothetical protein Bca52824_092023 [Brassica carinata]